MEGYVVSKHNDVEGYERTCKIVHRTLGDE